MSIRLACVMKILLPSFLFFVLSIGAQTGKEYSLQTLRRQIFIFEGSEL